MGGGFKLYREQGLQACLEINPGGHQRASVITGKILEQLKVKLSDPIYYFTSYKQIHQWLQTEHGINLSYGHVHGFVHRRIGGKAKSGQKEQPEKGYCL